VSLIEDELLMRRMLEQLIVSRPELALTHSVGGFQEAALVISPGSTDVVLVDVNLGDGDGITLASRLQRRDPHLSVLVLSSTDSMGAFMAAQEETPRPWSYLSKRSSFAVTTLVRTISAAAAGRQVIDPSLVDRSRPRADSAVERLSPAQLRVLVRVAKGLSNEAIATELGIAVRSVENHLLAIYRTLDLGGAGRNRRVLATLAFLEQTSRTGLR
jgi:DNA-binding NarL/FixJ family response regulator